MNRAALEHIIRAAATITDTDDIVVVGSQAVLGQFPDAPAAMLASDEADVFPLNNPALAELIEGSIGELSLFHDTFGYYAQGVGPETAVLPEGWRERLVPVCNENTRGATGWCLEIHDLLLAKYAAGRPKDRDYVRVAIAAGLAAQATLEARLATLPVASERRQVIAQMIAGDFARGK